jgi:hypothetical protein
MPFSFVVEQGDHHARYGAIITSDPAHLDEIEV